MTERELANNICACHAKTLVDEAGGITLGGYGLSEQYANKLYRAGGFDPQMVYECATALKHWVSSAGYDREGNFKYIISNHILNC